MQLAFCCRGPDPLREPDRKAVCLEHDRGVLFAGIKFVGKFLSAFPESRVQEHRREAHLDELRLAHYRLRKYHAAHLLLCARPAIRQAGVYEGVNTNA